MSRPDELTARLRSVVAGHLPAWPARVDHLGERWFALAPRLRLAVIVLTVVVLGLTAVHVASRSPWGADVAVLVAARDVPAGSTLVAGDVIPAIRPAGTVPRGAVEASSTWVGSVLTGPLPEGAVVTAVHLVEAGLSGLVAPGRVAVAIPAGLLPPLEPGQYVDLLGGDGDLAGQHLARAGRVLANDGEHVWIEVDRTDAAAIGAVIAWGHVTVALLAR